MLLALDTTLMRSTGSSHDTISTQRRSVQSVKDTTCGGSRTRGAWHPGLDLLAGALPGGSEPPSGRPKRRLGNPLRGPDGGAARKEAHGRRQKTHATPPTLSTSRVCAERSCAQYEHAKGGDRPTVLRMPFILDIMNLLQVLILAVISVAPG